MKNKKIYKVLGAIALFALILITILRLKNNKAATESKVYHYDKQQSISVTVDTIKLQSTSAAGFYAGTFEPDKESKLSAELQGKINSIAVETGSNVSKGQLLIELDNTLLKLQLKTIEVQIEALEKDVKRYKILAAADAVQGVQLEKSETALKSAQVQRESILEQIKKTSIYAPFSGVITAKLTEIGSFAAPGAPLLQLTEINTLRFIIHVSEKDLPVFKTGQINTIRADAMPDKKLEGKITMIGSKSNMGNSFPVQFTVQNSADNAIKAGMFGKVEMAAGDNEQGVVIPASAVTGTAEHPQVYIAKNGKATLVSITISKRTENKIVVSAGLQKGDVIITNGFVNLFDGANISTK